MSGLDQIKLVVNDVEINRYVINLFVKPLFVLFVYFGFFSRFTGAFGLSGGVLAVLITLVLFLLCFLHILYSRFFQVSPLALLIGAFFFLAAVTPMVSSYLRGVDSSISLRFSIELVIIFCMFFNTYYLMRIGALTPRFFLFSLVGVAIFSALQLVYLVLGQESFYRLRGLGGTNYIANVFSLSACSLMLIVMKYQMDHERLKRLGAIILLFLFLVVIFLIGSRQAIIAVVAGFGAINILAINSKKILLYNLIGMGLVLVFIIMVGSTLDLSFLMQRFTYDNLSYATSLRFEHFSRSVLDLTFADFMIGRPDYYEEVNPGGASTVVPHNIFLSLIRYNGIFLLILFIGLLAAIYLEYLKLRIKHNSNRRFVITESSIAVLLLVVLIYTMLSGQLTKIFTLFVIMGYSAGYIDLMKSQLNDADYLKMIL